MSFDLLLGKLNEVAVLAKALPADAALADDKKIAAAAGEEGQDGEDVGADDDTGGDAGAGAAGDDGDGDGDDNDDDGEEKPLAKSFMLALEDGTQLEAFDGTELVKSLTLRVETAESALKHNEDQVLKSLNAAVDLISGQSLQLKEQGALVKEQGVLIKSLQGKVSELAKSGRGRTSTLTVVEKPQLESTLAKSHTAEMGRDELLAKSMSAMQSGRITGLEASGIETRLNMGMPIDPELISRISSGN